VELTTGCLLDAADLAIEQWSILPDEVWEATGIEGSWTPRRTLDHLVDVMFLYSSFIAGEPPPESGHPVTVTQACQQQTCWMPSGRAREYWLWS